MHLTLRPASTDDIDEIMAIERGPGFEAYVGRSDRPGHEAMFASPRYCYFLGEDENAAPLAFAIVRDIDDPHGNFYLKRIVAAQPGLGVGTTFLALLLDWAFANPAIHRFYLDCFADNARAQAAYAKLGFSRDGVLREAYRASNGIRRDLTLMALTRPEWSARRGTTLVLLQG